jgi:hypothetical protein
MNYSSALAEMDRLYPPERIAASQARYRAVWNLERPAEIPFAFMFAPYEHGFGPLAGEAGLAREQMLDYLLGGIIARGQLADDYVPSLSPGLRQGLIPTAYGAEEIWDGTHFWVKPMIDSAAEFRSLAHPDFTRAGVAAKILDDTRFYRAATQGRLPVQMPDMQGPLDLASNFLGTERLIEEMYDHPEDVDALLDCMADDFIEFMRLEQQAAQGCLVPIHCHPMVWLPYDRAMALSEDLLAVISPRLYPRFGVPANERVARAFGHIIIHSCGSIEHTLQPLAKTQGLLGLNFGVSETDIHKVAEQFGNRIVIVVHGTPVTCNHLPLIGPYEFVDIIFDYIKDNDLRAIPIIRPDGLDLKECIELSQYAREKARWK